MADEDKNPEFEAFLAQLRSETPDIGALKAGMEKFGLSYFSDSQKETFLKALFPSQTPKNAKESDRPGFQKMHGIRNALNALQQLQSEGKISKDQMKDFLALQDPTTGKNVMTTIATQTRATEFKRKHITDQVALAELDKNLAVATEIQKTLGKLDSELLAEAVKIPDASKPEPKKYSDYTHTKQGRASLVAQSVNAPLEVETDAQETFKIGGETNAQPLELDGATPQTPLQPDQNTDEVTPQVATLDKPNVDGPGKEKSDWSFKRVSQKDIIDYMYEEWFLEGLNKGLEEAFKLLDRLIDAFCGGFESSPEKSAAAQRTPASAQNSGASGGSTPRSGGSSSRENDNILPSDFMGRVKAFADRSTDNYLQSMDTFNRNPVAVMYMLQCVEHYIGKEADQWVVAKEQRGTFDPQQHRGLIEKLNEIYRKDPQTFNERLQTLQAKPALLGANIRPEKIKLSAQLAALDIALRNPSLILDDSAKAQQKIEKGTFTKMTEFSATAAQIFEKNSKEYRLKHNLSPEGPLSDSHKRKITEKALKEFTDYSKGVLQKATTVRDLLKEYHQETDDSQKVTIEQKLKNAEKEYRDFYGKYLDGDKEGGRTSEPKEKQIETPKGKIDLREAANIEKRAQQQEQIFTADVDIKGKSIEGRRQQNDKSKKLIQESKKRTKNTGSKPSSRSKIQRKGTRSR